MIKVSIDKVFSKKETKEEKDRLIQDEKNINGLSYLSLTDWYVTRFIETGIEIPSEISIKRKEARESIVYKK